MTEMNNSKVARVMSSFMGRFRHKRRQKAKMVESVLTFNALRFLGVLVRMMNRRMTLRFASLLGDVVHKVVALRRDMVYRNIGITFPEKSPAEVRAIATKVYRNISCTLFEVLRIPLIRTRADIAALVDIDDEEFLRRTERGHTGAVLVSAHFGNWELMAMALGLMLTPITIIVKELSNVLIDRKMNELRTSGGNSILYGDYAIRNGLKLLDSGGVLAILSDQSDPSATYFGNFLGRRATMFHGAAFFALKAKVPLFVIMCISNGNEKYKIEMQEINTSDLIFCKEDIAILASRYTKVIEEYIIARPE